MKKLKKYESYNAKQTIDLFCSSKEIREEFGGAKPQYYETALHGFRSWIISNYPDSPLQENDQVQEFLCMADTHTLTMRVNSTVQMQGQDVMIPLIDAISIAERMGRKISLPTLTKRLDSGKCPVRFEQLYTAKGKKKGKLIEREGFKKYAETLPRTADKESPKVDKALEGHIRDVVDEYDMIHKEKELNGKNSKAKRKGLERLSSKIYKQSSENF